MTYTLHNWRRLLPWLLLLAAISYGAIGGAAVQGAGSGATLAQAPPTAAQPPVGEWQSLFDGKTLKGWKETPFSGHGKVRVQDGAVVLGTGFMTGITWTEPFPRSNYEVRLEAARLDGSDFFAGITFPVKAAYCSWINGGWGGEVIGLSSLDDRDASENETTLQKHFETGRWYALRLRVTDERIQAWIDNEQFINVSLEGKLISLRPGEIDLSVPFGIATYSTTGAVRKLEYRLLPPPGGGEK